MRTPSRNVLAPMLPQRHRTLAQPRVRRGGRVKDQMIMLYSSMAGLKSRMVPHLRVGPDSGLSTHGPAGLIVKGKRSEPTLMGITMPFL